MSCHERILSENTFPNLITADVMIDDDILDATANTEHSDLSGYQTKVDINIISSKIVESSSEELFRAIDKKLSSKTSKLEALMFYYYSYLIKHADLHLKNIGALEIGNKKYILAPLYDLISVGVYNGESLDLGLPMKEPFKKPKNWKIDDFYKLAKLVGVSEVMFKREARAITQIYITIMPKYIKKLENFEIDNPLPVQKIKLARYKGFTSKINNMFQERIITLQKLGIIDELGLVDVVGGFLSAQRNKDASAKELKSD